MDVFGRSEAIATGAAAFHSAGTGRGRCVLVAGEAGIGKTTVALAFAEEAARAGALVRWAGCRDGASVPLAPWIELLGISDTDPSAAVGARLAEGEVDATWSDAATGLRMRHRLYGQVVDALRAAAADAAQVVVLDDLHWADAASVELFCALASQLSTMGVLLVGTFRDDELDSAHPLRSLSGPVDRVVLAGLDEDDIGRVLSATLGRDASADELAGVIGHSGGNPLLVTHLGRLLASGAPLGVPAGARDILTRRLARVPAQANDVLGAAAVLGAEFNARVAARMLDMDEKEVLHALDIAATTRIVQPVPGRAGAWAFTHSLLQAVRYECLASAERMRLHRRACDVLAESERARAVEVAAHALRASFDADDAAPARYAVAAGDEVLSRFGRDEAIALYEHTLERAPATEDGDRVRGAALLGLGAARLRRDDAAGAAAAFEAAAAIGRAGGDADLIGRAALGFGAGLGGFEIRMFDPRQTVLLEEGVAAVGVDSPLRPWLLARLSVALSFVGSVERRIALADEALTLARNREDNAATAAALAARCDAISGPEFTAERSATASEITALGVGLRDRRVELLGRRLRVAALAELCDVEALDNEVAAFERTAAALGDPLYGWYAPLWRAMRALTRGEFALAEQLRHDAASLGAEAGSGNARVLTTVIDLFIALESGDIKALEATLHALAREFPELLLANGQPMITYTGCVLDAPGWRERAAAVLATAREMPRDAEWLCTIAPLTELADRLGEVDRAAELYDMFAPFTGLGVVEGIAAVHRGATDRYLMVLAAMIGDERQALEHLDGALVVAARLGPLVLDDTQRAGADALRRFGETHADRAAELDAEARRIFARLGVAPSDHVASPIPPLADAAAASFVREGDAWAVTWEGRTVRIRDAKGVRDLAVLLATPDREFHVRELDGSPVPPARSEQPVLDAEAVDSYRRRLRAVEAQLDEADRHGDVARAARAADERDALVTELSRAFGVGGRARRVGPDPDERLRKAVSGRVRASVDRLAQLDAALGRHLRHSVHTGMWCVYAPEQPVAWSVRRG